MIRTVCSNQTGQKKFHISSMLKRDAKIFIVIELIRKKQYDNQEKTNIDGAG